MEETYAEEYAEEMKEAKLREQREAVFSEKVNDLQVSNVGKLIIRYLDKHSEGDTVMHIANALSKSISPQELTDAINCLLDNNILLKNEAGWMILNENYREEV